MVEKTSKMNPLLVIGIGCFIVLIIVGTAIKAGTSLLQGVIENKTGVKTNLDDLEKGKLSFTDTKTGQKVEVGSEELPNTFPKDFPLYPGAKIAGSVSNSQAGNGNGFIVTFTTPDGLPKVVPFYKTGLNTNGWTTGASFDSDTIQNWVVSNATMEGSVSITSERDQTTILVTLEKKE